MLAAVPPLAPLALCCTDLAVAAPCRAAMASRRPPNWPRALAREKSGGGGPTTCLGSRIIVCMLVGHLALKVNCYENNEGDRPLFAS